MEANFKEASALTSRKYVSERNFKLFGRTPPLFFFRKTTLKSKFLEFFLPLKHPSVATFNRTRAPTSRKYVAEKGIIMPNLSEKL